jgi:glycosyltransferase involved in cell wall biosynthesis
MSVELSIVIPCLNEAETLPRCIAKARQGLERAGVAGEILVADNGSDDGSIQIAEEHGARVERVAAKGYGSALRGGIAAARGRWIIMGDGDDSYDFSQIGGFVEKLRAGCDLVMGCRFPAGGGQIAPGAMPWKNRWLGNPMLSWIGRLFFHTPIHDFHCGLRGFSKEACERMQLVTTGMEFASEMVIKAALYGLRVGETPITLHKDGRSRPPHLQPWRDGWRHLRFMLIYSPRWLFLLPGLWLAGGGTIGAALIFTKPRTLGSLHLEVGTLTVACLAVIVGVQLVAFAFYTKVFAVAEGLLPPDARFSRIFRVFTLEKGIAAGALVFLAGFGLLAWAVLAWQRTGFGMLPYAENLRRVVTASTLIAVGLEIIFSSFFLSVLGLKTTTRRPP